MTIDVFVTPMEIPVFYTRDRRVVVVDVLRACTSITYALDHGVDQVIPVTSVEGATQLLHSLDRASTLLAGEQDGSKLPGFDLGNSPHEFRGAGVAGKTVIYSSPNGAPLLSRNLEAVEKVLLSLVNVQAVAEYLRTKEDDELTVICAGHEGRFALEDAVCAGMLIDQLGPGNDAELNDAARAAWILFLAHRKDLGSICRSSAQGRFLHEHGHDADLTAAADVDALSLVPVVEDGRIRAASSRRGRSRV